MTTKRARWLVESAHIVTTSERSDLAPIIARWLWEEFWQHSGKTIEHLLQAAEQTARTAGPIPRTYVMIDGDEPIGTASLLASDLASRPDLTPWLAGVYVAPESRSRGAATRLLRAAEAHASDIGVTTLWLHTRSAERPYAQLGWHSSGAVVTPTGPSTLMRRSL